MNVKKMNRRVGALERFKVLPFDQVRDREEDFDRPYTDADYNLYLDRKQAELNSLKKYHGVQI